MNEPALKELDRQASEGEIPPPEKTGEGETGGEAEGVLVPPAAPAQIVTDTTFRKTIVALQKRYPRMELTPEEIDLLADVWPPALNDLYARVLAMFDADPATVNPWSQALAATAFIAVPRVIGLLGLSRVDESKSPPG